MPVFMKEPTLPGTPLVAMESAAISDHVTNIPAIVTSVVVSSVLQNVWH